MKYIIKILGGAIFIGIFSQLTMDTLISDVQIPITGQTLAVLLVAYLYVVKEAVGAVILYIIIGSLGLPVFADGGSGIETLMGNSGGYIVGFIFGSYVTSLWAAAKPNTWYNACMGMLLGTLIIMILGVMRLSLDLGWEKALVYGFYPFIIGGLIKIVIGGIMGKLLKNRGILGEFKV